MPPMTARQPYLHGALGKYFVPTTRAVEGCLRELRHRMKSANPDVAERIRADIDLLLDRLLELEGQ